VHVPGQLIPAGVLNTLPEPLPCEAIVTATPARNSALQLTFRCMETVAVVAVPKQSPVQPTNVEPAFDVATSVTGSVL
jgi:hypothetical protein